jgi:hypothetical protein
MPYICLARNDIPDGTLQVLDLWPNTSLRNQSIDPPGQTRYINRAQNEALTISTVAGVSTVGNVRAVNGLAAYIADKVAPGGTQAASETVQMVGVLANDTVTLGGVVFTAVDGGAADPSLQQFDSLAGSGSNINTATSLAAALNHANTDAALQASPTGGSTVTAANGGTDTVTITADITGPVGAMPITTSTGVRLVLGDASGHLDRAHEEWTSAQVLAAAAGIIARVDSGAALAEANINTVINGVAGVSGVDIVHASSSSTVREFLSILAGRGYRVEAGAQFASAEGRWESALAPVGSFTDAVSVFDTQMLSGELRPFNPFKKLPNNESTTSQNNRVQGSPGSTLNVEYKGIRHTVDGDAMQVSLQSGALARMQDGTVSLFLDNIYSAFKGDANGYANFSQPGPQTAQVNNARLVTVYDDDGSLL